MSSDRTFPALQQRFRAAEANVRAPRGGVAFNGTAGQRVFGGLTGQNIGTDAASFAIGIRVPSAVPSASQGIFSVNSSGATVNVARSFFAEWRNDAGGHIRIWLLGATTGDSRAFSLTNIVNTFAGEEITLVLVRNGATITPYINGVVWTSVTTESTTGTPPSWADTITSTFYLLGTNSTGGSEHLVGPVRFFSIYNLALSAADVAEIHRNGGAVPERFQFGSKEQSSNTFATEGGAGAFHNSFSGSSTGFTGTTTNNPDASSSRAGKATARALRLGQQARIRFDWALSGSTAGNNAEWIVRDSSGAGTNLSNWSVLGVGNVSGAVNTTITALANTANAFVYFGAGDSTGQNVTLAVSNFSFEPLGAVVHLDSESGGIGFQWHDSSTNKLDAVLSLTGVSWLKPVRRGFLRGSLSWAGTQEFKSILGQRSLPPGAVVTLVTTKATAGSTGSGLIVGEAVNTNRFVVANAYTTAKKVHVLANQLPVNDGTDQNNVGVDPDTANYTGTIDVEVHYTVTEGNP